jgi:hypothetical protein
MKMSKARMITAPIIAPIRTPLTDDFVVVVEVEGVTPVFLVVVVAAEEVVVVVFAKAAKTAKVLKWSTEAVIV